MALLALLGPLAGGLAAVGKLLGAIYPKMKRRIRFRSNLKKLNKEMGKLTNLGNAVKEQIEEAKKRRGQVAAAPAVKMWLEDLEAINKEVSLIETQVGGTAKMNKVNFVQQLQVAAAALAVHWVKKYTRASPRLEDSLKTSSFFLIAWWLQIAK